MSLSAHLVEQYDDRKPILPPHLRPNQSNAPNPMQVKPDPDQSWYSKHGDSTMMSNGSRITSWSEERVAQLQARLRRKLGPEYVTQRPGPGGGPKLSYIEGWKVINLANEVFGFNGWSSSITQLSVDFLDVNKEGRCSVNVTAIVRITLQDGCFHEDVGCGSGENIRGKASALDKAKKEAVTDATKRALKSFGNVLGNCLYDKEYAKEVVKMKVPPPKFDQKELERRPEFAPVQPPQAPAQAQAQAGPSRPPPAPMANTNHDHTNQSAAKPTVVPGSPLRAVDEVDADYDMTMVEEFDGEFLDAGGESFFDIVDTSTETSKVSNGPHAQSEAGPSKPAYQHRHRPDQPPPIGAAGRPPGIESKRSFSRAVSSDEAQARRMAAILGNAVPPPEVPLKTDDAAKPHQSSGGNSTTVTETVKQVKAVGAFNPQLASKPAASTVANANGQSARALAIQSALRNGDTGPIRSVSPQIPGGGVDAVAARATAHMKTYGQKLELEEAVKQVIESPGAAFGGFASARGMKRSISEHQGGRNGSVSPTKPGNQPRQALGEIQIDEGGQKRSRA